MTPDSIESRLARLDEHFQGEITLLKEKLREVERLAEKVERLPAIEAHLDDIADDAATCRANVHRLRNDLQAGLLGIRNDLNAERVARDERRSRTVIALIAASATVLAAIVAGVFVLLGGG